MKSESTNDGIPSMSTKALFCLRFHLVSDHSSISGFLRWFLYVVVYLNVTLPPGGHTHVHLKV